LETHRRSWLRQRTDASPHTSYLFQFLKSFTVALGFRCSPSHFRARQKRNSKMFRSFRQPLDFHLKASASTRTSFLTSRLATGIRCEGAHLTASFLAVNPLEFFYFRGVRDLSEQLLRKPFFNRRPLRRRRILLSRCWPSTPSNFLFSR